MRTSLVIAAVLAGIATSAAAETTTYSYDEQGRLTAVVHSGAVNNGLTAGYGYDKVDNRVSSSVTGSSH